METLTTTKVHSAHTHEAAYPTQKATTTRASTTQASQPDQPQLSAPASQESFFSVQSTGSSVAPPRLQASDSNLSQLTSYTDTDHTSHTSPNSSAGENNANGGAASSDKPHTQRNKTPENGLHLQHNVGSALASPMSITSPVSTNGAKRTASGHVKNAPSLPGTPYGPSFPGREARRDSMSSSGSRAGELAASLKTRLGYAMAKVQHGWEHKSLQEVEELASHRSRSNRYSMSHVDQYRPGTSGLSNGTSRLSMYDQNNGFPQEINGPPSKRHSGTYTGYMFSNQQPPYAYTSVPCLQPAPDIRPTSSSRSSHPQSTGFRHQYTNAMSPPQTPVSTAPRRPPTIRTETQTKDAEMEALQALIGLGSPRTSYVPTSSQSSPNKMDQDTPRRVTFARSGSNSSASSSIPGTSRLTSQAEHVDVR